MYKYIPIYLHKYSIKIGKKRFTKFIPPKFWVTHIQKKKKEISSPKISASIQIKEKKNLGYVIFKNKKKGHYLPQKLSAGIPKP